MPMLKYRRIPSLYEYDGKCVPEPLVDYSTNQHTVALVHFPKYNVTKIGMYDMIQHELCPWVTDFGTLYFSYNDDLPYCMSALSKLAQQHSETHLDDVIIWVGFRANPGFWNGKGDAKSGFIFSGTSPFDEETGEFILSIHPEQHITPEWVFDYINEQMVMNNFNGGFV